MNVLGWIAIVVLSLVFVVNFIIICPDIINRIFRRNKEE